MYVKYKMLFYAFVLTFGIFESYVAYEQQINEWRWEFLSIGNNLAVLLQVKDTKFLEHVRATH